ncbi:hypothetical protein [Rhodococcus sp. JVH1]|uniref:hypothetical protein n=1 Tax=Rhodococcus sp. JVH1 TaxID=745408 RepID=UPI003524762A
MGIRMSVSFDQVFVDGVGMVSAERADEISRAQAARGVATQRFVVGADELTAHFMSTPIYDQVRRDLRATWLQQPGPAVSDAEFDHVADEAIALAKPYPPTPDLFDRLAAAIDDAPEPSFWDRLEDWIAKWGVRLVALLSIAVFTYVALAYFGVIPVVRR